MHWRRNTFVAAGAVLCIGASLYTYSTARESYTDAHQNVYYAPMDQRRKWAIKEARAKKLAQANYTRTELGQRPESQD